MKTQEVLEQLSEKFMKLPKQNNLLKKVSKPLKFKFAVFMMDIKTLKKEV